MDKTLLIILDGFGLNYNQQQNPTLSADSPNLDNLVANYPFTVLSAAGEEVGLSWGEVGNSEVGHFNLGSGQVLWQNLPKIDQAISSGSFFDNNVLNETMEAVKKEKSNLHLMGLVSDGGIHSHVNHLIALLKLAKRKKVPKVYIHMISDGRDTPPKSGIEFLKRTEAETSKIGLGKVSTITGRQIAMDRNNDWQKTAEFYMTTTGQQIEKESIFENGRKVFENLYDKKKNDETIPPSVVDLGDDSQFIKDNDGLIIFNFRADRSRQIAKVFGDPSLEEFERSFFPNNLKLATMTPYEEDWKIEIQTVFDPPKVEDSVPKLIANNNLSQSHLAESEKKAHVTYFFNGGIDQEQKLETNNIIPSPQIESFDLKPEMSLDILGQVTIKAIKKNNEFILVNVANPDMVGHTGNFEATKTAIEAVDSYLGKILTIAGRAGYLSLITADHGNSEQMINPSSERPDKEHTVNPVPFFWVDNYQKSDRNFDKDGIWQAISQLTPTGILADVSRTVLSNLQVEPSTNMIGEDLRNSLVKL